MSEMWGGSECQKNRVPQVSFEFFPPKTDALSASLWSAFQELLPFKPIFVSVTYGATIPASIAKLFETASDEPGEAQKIALDIAGEQCLKLLSSGVGHLHFYTLNRADLVSEICRVLGIGVCSAAEPILVVPS